jgi:hypothetical protein
MSQKEIAAVDCCSANLLRIDASCLLLVGQCAMPLAQVRMDHEGEGWRELVDVGPLRKNYIDG